MLSPQVKDTIRYWETRRIAYNAVLTCVAIAWVAATWPHFRSAFTLEHSLALFVLVILANVCYSAAYVAEIPFSVESLRTFWGKWRWSVWVLGTLLAVVVENYWIADEIYPDIR